MQSHYPERLFKAFLFNVPMVFRAAWSMISPWIDARTAKKVVFCGADFQSELLQLIAPESLEQRYGGSKPDDYPVVSVEYDKRWACPTDSSS